jgi:signal transduction histidine kinase
MVIKVTFIMQQVLERYIGIILSHSALLLEPSDNPLSDIQRNSIGLIQKYTNELNSAISRSEALSEEEMRRFMRHELLNLLTPIVGYVEMLQDGWIGKLNLDQSSHIEIIAYAVQDVLEIIESQKIRLAS